MFTSGEEAELQHLCLEVAAAATLSPEEEKALVEAEKQQLDEAADLHPPDVASLPQPLLVLRCRPEGWGDDEGQETTFYILGTAHISRQSCEDVAALIRAVRPQASAAARLQGTRSFALPNRRPTAALLNTLQPTIAHSLSS